MTHRYPDLGSASLIGCAAWEGCFIQSEALPRSVMRRQYGISVHCFSDVISWETSRGITK